MITFRLKKDLLLLPSDTVSCCEKYTSFEGKIQLPPHLLSTLFYSLWMVKPAQPFFPAKGEERGEGSPFSSLEVPQPAWTQATQKRKGVRSDEDQKEGHLKRGCQTAGSEVLGNDEGC